MNKHTSGPLMQYGRMVNDTTETVGGMFAIKQSETTPRGTQVGVGTAIGYAYEQADAVLWSAAPELLKALNAILAYLDALDPEHDDTSNDLYPGELRKSAAAAIANAKGRS